MKRVIIFITILAVVAFNINVYGNETESNVITVGICADYSPFEYYENDVLCGFDVELMNTIGDITGYAVVYVDMYFDELISAVANGDVDCAISAIAITDERNKVIDFTTPYLSASVTYTDGDSVSKFVEKYGIVFPHDSVEKESLIYASGDSTKLKYTIVNNAIRTLLANDTVKKLAEKYNLSKATDDDQYDYEFAVCEVPSADEVISDAGATIPVYDTFEEIGMENPLPGDWARDIVDKAYEIGIAKDSYFFTKPITREEFCELIYNLIISVNGMFAAPFGDGFSDTENPKVLMLSGAGIINGKSQTTFCPNDALTRAEAATIIVRMINKLMPMEATEMWFEFDDGNSIPVWASDSIQTICNLGFMKGVGDNRFAPDVAYTAEQAIVTLVRVYERAIESGNANTGIIVGEIPSFQ